MASVEEDFIDGYRSGISAAIRIVQDQPNYPDTKVGMRQQWVREQIVAMLNAAYDGPFPVPVGSFKPRT